jgi:hypothetical protein
MPFFERFVARAAADGDIARAFEEDYVGPNRAILEPLFADWEAWSRPFARTLESFDPGKARAAIERAKRRGYPERAARVLERVEAFFGRPLEGELALIAGFGRLDGYARFDRGRHCVYIGVDYPEEADFYLDLIVAHELAHVAREGDPATWRRLGLPPDMTHDEFQERCPFEEHMIGEGLSTALSEEIFPGHRLHDYLFFEEEQAAWCLAHEAEIRSGLRRFRGTCEEHYALYAREVVAPGSPERVQYYWGYKLVKNAAGTGIPLRALFSMPASDIMARGGDP